MNKGPCQHSGCPSPSATGRGVEETGGSTPVKTIIVEDDPETRELLGELIRGQAELRLLGGFDAAESALEACPTLCPDVALMDINLPGLSGIEAAREIRGRLPGCQILMLTVFSDGEHLFDALKAGAGGYLLKRAAPREITEAIVQLHAGGSPISPAIARRIVETLHGPASVAEDAKQADGLEKLTERESEILSLMSRGTAPKEAADRLGISVFTVRSHIRRIYRKLEVNSQTQALSKYRRGD